MEIATPTQSATEELAPISLSEAAAKEIKSIIADQGLTEAETRLRVGVQGGGCSGFKYLLDLTEEPKAEMDEEIESNGSRSSAT
jgi:iron-sulfur cluster assembly protein